MLIINGKQKQKLSGIVIFFEGQYDLNPHLEDNTPSTKLNPHLLNQNHQPPPTRGFRKMAQPPPHQFGGVETMQTF